MSALSRKLTLLGHPRPDRCDVGDQAQFRRLVVWLEDQKIRQLTIDERGGLRAVQSDQWPKAFQQYLYKLSCPLGSDSLSTPLTFWLLNHAIKLEFGEASDAPVKNGTAPKVTSTSRSIDTASPEFKAGVEALADKLQIGWHPDPCVRLAAVARFTEARLNKAALANPKLFTPQGQPYPFREQKEQGLDGGDKALNEAVSVLRLLYIQDLRALQTSINECIVSVQKVTANPKTDTRLGKVGR